MRRITENCPEGPYQATALVFAGGKSRRMGTEKAFIPIQGTLLTEKVLSQLKSSFSEILLCVSSEGKYDFLNTPHVVDDQPCRGPLGALLSGLRASDKFANFALACDIPEVNPDLVKKMFEFSKSCDIVVPTTGFGKYEPLFAFYNKNVIFDIENLLAGAQRRLSLLFSRCRIVMLA